MRWLVLLLLLAGFDHAAHDLKATIACKSCHAVDAKGRTKPPGHKACFGACHGPTPKKKDQKTGAVCEACHAPAPDSLGMVFDHSQHDAQACASCHAAQAGVGSPRARSARAVSAGATPTPANPIDHARCIACHRIVDVAGATSGGEKLDACTTCHAGTSRPAIAAGPLAPTAFDHARHPKADCAACHAASAGASGDALPAPSTNECGVCHDGKKAFAVTDACTKCHTAGPTAAYALARPSAPFSHARHAARGVGDCASCHTIDARGEASAPDHSACAGCHASDFASTTPTICAACHVSIEPWRKLVADAPPPPATEFGAQMPHRAHAQLGLACEGCHQLADAQRQLRPPHGHAACAPCHLKDQQPLFTDCDGCHRLGLADARVALRLGAKWSVRARFQHAPHSVATCATCHAKVWEVDGPPPAPAKATCAACHDGKTAFKMTGHGCAKCHAGGESTADSRESTVSE